MWVSAFVVYKIILNNHIKYTHCVGSDSELLDRFAITSLTIVEILNEQTNSISV